MEKSEAHQLYLEPSLILRTYRFLRILFVINVHPGDILFTSRSPLNKALLFRLKFPGSLKERRSEIRRSGDRSRFLISDSNSKPLLLLSFLGNFITFIYFPFFPLFLAIYNLFSHRYAVKG